MTSPQGLPSFIFGKMRASEGGVGLGRRLVAAVLAGSTTWAAELPAARAADSGGATPPGSVTLDDPAPSSGLGGRPRAVSGRIPPPPPGPTAGTRLPDRGFSAAPILVLERADIEATGRVTLAEVLQRLPLAGNGLNVQFNNGGNGSARFDLRSLGPARNLILLNGRRFVPGGDGADESVDLDAIPLAFVERIEILTGGASSIHGSGAIAGVVNVVTRRDVEGVEARVFTGLSERGDAATYQVDVTAGVRSEDGRGHLVLAAMIYDQQPVSAADRAFARATRRFDFGAYRAAGAPEDEAPFLSPGGSSATPGGRVVDRLETPGNAAWDSSGCAGGACQNDPAQGWRPVEDPGDLYEFQPENHLVTPSRRLGLMTQGRYAPSPALGFFFEGSLHRRASEQRLAPTPLFTSSEGLRISRDNVFNPFGRDFVDLQRRLLELGPRRFRQESHTFRLLTGIEGELPPLGPLSGWQWSGHLSLGRTETSNTAEGRVHRARLASSTWG